MDEAEYYRRLMEAEEEARAKREPPATAPSARAQEVIKKIKEGPQAKPTTLPPRQPVATQKQPITTATDKVTALQPPKPELKAPPTQEELKLAVYPTANIIANSQEFHDRVAQRMATGGMFTIQQDVEKRVAAEMLREGKEVKTLPAWEAQKVNTDFQKGLKKELSAEDWQAFRQYSADFNMRPLELFVPGLETVRYWTRTTPLEKGLSISGDVVAVGLMIFGGKLFSKIGSPQQAAIRQANRLATNAGKAATKYAETYGAYQRALETGLYNKIPKGKLVMAQTASKAQKLAQSSYVADLKFTNYLKTVDVIPYKNLKSLEKASNIKGLARSISDVSKQAGKLDRAWAKIPENKLFTTSKDAWARTGKMINLTSINKIQAKLDKALGKADSILKPRYRPGYPPEPPDVKITPKKQINIDFGDVNRILAKQKPKPIPESEYRGGGTTSRVRTAVKERIQLDLDLKTKPKAPIKPIPEAKPKVTTPRVTSTATSVFPGIRTHIKATPTPDEGTTPTIQEDVVSKRIPEEEAGIVTKPTPKTPPKTTPGIGVTTAVTTEPEAGVETPPKTKPKQPKKPQPEPKIQPKPMTKVVTETEIKTTTETKKAQKTKVPVGKFPIPPGKGGEAEEWTEEDIKSAIAWKVGFAIHALKSPYRRGIDEKSWHISKAPKGLAVFDVSGPGSQQRSVRVTGRFPSRLTVDVGNQDVVMTRAGPGRVHMRHFRDTTGTTSMLTIKRHNKPVSRKRGGMYHTNVAGGLILSRKPLRVF